MEPADVQKLLTHAKEMAPSENAYSMYMYIMFFLNTLLTIISLYLFLNRRSKLHSELRSIVTHTTLSSFAMTATMTLWQVVVLPPYVGGKLIFIWVFINIFILGYPLGWIFKKIGPYSFLFGLWICWRLVVSFYGNL